MVDQLFKIFEVTQTLVDQTLMHPEAPHRHDYEKIIVSTAGQMDHYIDFKMERTSSPSVVFIPLGKIHYTMPTENARGWVIQFRAEFAPNSAFSTLSKLSETAYYPFSDADTMTRMVALCRVMKREFEIPSPDYDVIRHLLYALMAMIKSEHKKSLSTGLEEKTTQVIVFHNFLNILESQYRNSAGCQSYAEKLNISVRHLNTICHSVFGKSISEIIEARKLLEARQLLLQTSKTISEIGFELGYNEKSYFTRVFHKKTGLTPSEFRAASKRVSS